MDSEVAFTLSQICRTTAPEQIFGGVTGDIAQQRASLTKVYRRLAKIVHPDLVEESQRAQAEEATRTLNEMFQSGLKRIESCTYGTDKPTHTSEPSTVVVVRNRKNNYMVGELIESGQIYNTYACTFTQDGAEKSGLFTVSRLPGDNDLVKREAEVLRHLAADTEHPRLHIYVPELVDSFKYRESGSNVTRQANVLALPEIAADPKQWYSLEEVKKAYPNGITSADMAWMWRRLLVALGFAHRCGVIHGAVLPANIYIQPQEHGLLLTNWSYAVRDPGSTGERICAIDTVYESWYPQEVWDKSLPRPGLDLYMGARTMAYVLGGDPVTGKLPDSVARKYKAHLQGTALKSPTFRPQDAWQLLEEFDEMLGKRRFQPFSMPKKSFG